MKRFQVTVNGTTYDVAVSDADTAASAAAHTTAAAPVAAAAASPVADGTHVPAALSGTIRKVCTTVGDSVRKGQVLFLLEAMKMENEITAPVNGTIAQILAKPGDAVDAETVLAVIR